MNSQLQHTNLGGTYDGNALCSKRVPFFLISCLNTVCAATCMGLEELFLKLLNPIAFPLQIVCIKACYLHIEMRNQEETNAAINLQAKGKKRLWRNGNK